MREAVEPEGTSVRVGVGDREHSVHIGSGLLDDLPVLLSGHVDAHRFVVISDENVAQLHSVSLVDRCVEAGLDATLLTFPAGEASKTRKSWSILTDEMLEAGLGRDCCVVAVGGGVTTDLAGFVAATYMRGVPLVQVPTSYLAMIDASVGGKTGVDVRPGKNLVGAFHAPELVIIDPDVLATLAKGERRQGLVEAFKHGAILDASYFAFLFDRVEDLVGLLGDAPGKALLRSVQLKAGVVTEDEFEAGYRKILNFGHTVGHAVEAASDYRLGHGSAVAFGMVVEARIGEAVGVTEEGTAARLEEALGCLLPLAGPGLELEDVMSRMSTDKKARAGEPRLVLLEKVGKVAESPEWAHAVPTAVVAEAVEAALATPSATRL